MATQSPQQLADQLFAKRPEQSMGALAAAREGVKEFVGEMFPGLKNAGPQIMTELKHQLGQGAHELAAALFNGSAFVMYPRGAGKDDPAKDGPGIHGPGQGQDHAQQPDAPTQQHTRGGRGM
jgi:hypothetical protein